MSKNCVVFTGTLSHLRYDGGVLGSRCRGSTISLVRDGTGWILKSLYGNEFVAHHSRRKYKRMSHHKGVQYVAKRRVLYRTT